MHARQNYMKNFINHVEDKKFIQDENFLPLPSPSFFQWSTPKLCTGNNKRGTEMIFRHLYLPAKVALSQKTGKCSLSDINLAMINLFLL